MGLHCRSASLISNERNYNFVPDLEGHERTWSKREDFEKEKVIWEERSKLHS